MSFDLVILRGMVEKIIDTQLDKKNLANTHRFFEVLKPVVSNRVDAVFGYIVGQIHGNCSGLFSSLLKREATQEEVDEIANAIIKRFFEIKSKINETFT